MSPAETITPASSNDVDERLLEAIRLEAHHRDRAETINAALQEYGRALKRRAFMALMGTVDSIEG